MMIFTLFFIFLILVLVPENAFAWAPSTHLAIGELILANKYLLPSTVASLLSKYMYDFLYGLIGADVILGKNLYPYHEHCHNWKFGFLMRDKSRTDAQRAFSYGYIAHLASDVVAHNFFVPILMVKQVKAPVNTHFSWEYRAEGFKGADIIKTANLVIKNASKRDDELMEKILKKTYLPFKTNKAIFSSIIFVQRLNYILNRQRKIYEDKKHLIDKPFVKHYFDLSFGASVDILEKGGESKLINFNPTGKQAIVAARILKRARKSLIKKFGDENFDGFIGILKKYLPEEEELVKIYEQVSLKIRD